MWGLCALLCGFSTIAVAGEPAWVWYPDRDLENVPAVSRFFRHTFELEKAEGGLVEITADDQYELYINGERIGSDDVEASIERYDIGRFLVSGKNLIAVKAMNAEAGTGAALFVRVALKRGAKADLSHSANADWKSSSYGPRGWETLAYVDTKWTPAKVLTDREVPPSGGAPAAPQTAASATPSRDAPPLEPGRLTVAKGFKVEKILDTTQTGSAVGMAFNERGDLLISRESGPLMVVRWKEGEGLADKAYLFTDKVTSCQGILPLNGMVFVVGKGPQGASFCKLEDSDNDARVDRVETLFRFKSEMLEHGPHSAVLGPEGLIYLVLGNHTSAELEVQPTSPYHHPYEGDLVTPKYEDPSGHANGLKAPGGIVMRTDTDGSFSEVVAGGMRNAYDLAFNRHGELFTFDSEMEYDVGSPWYRPARVLHVTPGAEFGWRSGWSKWPAYYADSMPAVYDGERDSPAGLEFYHHDQFPAKYRDTMFVADWSLGRILAVSMKSTGGTYTGTTETIVQGQPLNVTDLAVGPDGALYFVTGGRGTEGGLFKLTYTGKVEPAPKGAGVLSAIRQPQVYSAYGRDRVARIKASMEPTWGSELVKFVETPTNSADERARALDLMQLVGPFPTTKLLLKVSRDKAPVVRSKIAYLMGIHADSACQERLVEMLDDADPMVVRQSLDSLVRIQGPAPVAKVLALMQKGPRVVRFAALRMLQSMPVSEWRSSVIAATEPRSFIYGSLALLALQPDDDVREKLIERSRQLLRGYLSDEDFVGILRVIEVTFIDSHLSEALRRDLAAELAEEFPAGDANMNRELVRILVYLQEESVVDRMLELLTDPRQPTEERLHLAMHLRFLENGWTSERKQQLMSYYEQARTLQGGQSLTRYVDNVARDFLSTLTARERGELLASGEAMPGMALQVLRSSPTELSPAQVEILVDLDSRVAPQHDLSSRDLATGLVALLGQCGEKSALEYIRKVFELYPERRQDVAMVLSTRPTEQMDENKLNWPLLIRSLPVIDGGAAGMVLETLAKVRLKPVKPEPFRQVILCGLRLDKADAGAAVAVLEHWASKKLGKEGDNATAKLALWQDWYRSSFPNALPPTLPPEVVSEKWTVTELVDLLNSSAGYSGDHEQGAKLFANKGQCIKCHRHGGTGEAIGPDLTNVGARFTRKEILQSVLHPSQVISDQYLSKTVVTKRGKSYTGLVGTAGGDTVVILQPDGRKVELKQSEIEETSPSLKSAMPDGLFDQFSKEEVVDLFAYLTKPATSPTEPAKPSEPTTAAKPTPAKEPTKK